MHYRKEVITMTEETRRKLSEAHKGKPSGHKGHHHSEESKKKMSEAHKAITDGTRHKMSESRKGHHHTEETKKKIAKAVHLASLEKHPYPGTWIKNV